MAGSLKQKLKVVEGKTNHGNLFAMSGYPNAQVLLSLSLQVGKKAAQEN